MFGYSLPCLLHWHLSASSPRPAGFSRLEMHIVHATSPTCVTPTTAWMQQDDNAESRWSCKASLNPAGSGCSITYTFGQAQDLSSLEIGEGYHSRGWVVCKFVGKTWDLSGKLEKTPVFYPDYFGHLSAWLCVAKDTYVSRRLHRQSLLSAQIVLCCYSK